MDPIQSVDHALRDLHDIKRAIARAERAGDLPGSLSAVSIHQSAHFVALVLVVSLLLCEIFTNHNTTNFLYFSFQSQTWRIAGIVIIASLLLILAISLHLSVWRAAQRSEESFENYVARNFLYLRSTSFVSDLFTKFCVVALVILARHPDWVSPLLVLFTGDYLLQGRFFILPTSLAMLLGLFYMAAAPVLLFFVEGYMGIAYAAFLLPCILSLLFTQKLRLKIQDHGEI